MLLMAVSYFGTERPPIPNVPIDLLSQFLSVKINRRYDGYGPPNELELLRQIISTIRAEPRIPNTFIVGVKLNAGDYAGNLVSEEYALAHVHTIAGWQNVDFLEIRYVNDLSCFPVFHRIPFSGGSYESPGRFCDCYSALSLSVKRLYGKSEPPTGFLLSFLSKSPRMRISSWCQ